MDEIEIFRKIVRWLLEKTSVTTNYIITAANITIDNYQLIVDGKTEPRHISVKLKAAIQDFNKKHYPDYLIALKVEALDDDPDYKDSIRPVQNKVEKSLSKEQVEIESDSVNDLLYNSERTKRRMAERIQEKVFNEALQRLRDVTPDHMTFDIILKHR